MVRSLEVADRLSPRSYAPEAPSRLHEDAAARRIVDALVAHGVSTFFGIPGGPAAPLFEAIRLHARARLVESRHETAAAFAAASYARLSGRVPALVVTAGPGITNAVTGIVSAHLERTPMVILAGDVAWAASGGVLAQDSGPGGIQAEQMLRACTRAQIRVSGASSAATQALAAFGSATRADRPGPALLVVPIDHATAPASATSLELLPCSPRGESAPLPDLRAAPAGPVQTTARWLASAERPLLVLGRGCRTQPEIVRELVDALGVPFVTTPGAKGLVSELHPCALRNGGMAASLWARRYTARPVDVALVLGTALSDTSIGPTPYLGPTGRLVHVDLDATVFGRSLPAALAVHADVGVFARTLRDLVAAGGPVNPRGAALARAARARAPFDVAQPERDARAPIAPHRAIVDLERAAGPDARFVSDIGEHMLFCLHYLTARDPQAFHIQLGLGSMGSGIAGAVGLALADPGRRVVCVCGDGGMQMFGMEALVARAERLPIVYAVFNDARYNMVHHGMKQIFGAAAPFATPCIDFCAWAGALGVPSARIERPGEIDAALLDALSPDGGPCLLDIRIDREVRVRGGGRVEALQQMSMPREQVNA